MIRRAIFTAAMTAAMVASATAGDWPQWRGPNRDGHSSEKGLLQEWPDDGPKQLWAQPVGYGYSTASIVGERVYTTGLFDGEGKLICLDAKTGQEQWSASYGKEWDKDGLYPSARSTPTIDDGMAYVVSGYGGVACFDAKSGERKWTLDMLKTYQGRNIKWGICESPLVVDDKLICTPGGAKASIVALDKKTGKEIWAAKPLPGRKGHQLSAYCSPALFEIDGKKLIVTHLSESVVAVDAEDGSVLWAVPHKNRLSIHPTTPVRHENVIVTSSGYRYGTDGIEISDDGGEARIAWHERQPDSQMGGVLLLDGRAYATGRNLVVMDVETGRKLDDNRDIGKGAQAYADGRMYWFDERGQIGLADISNRRAKVVSSLRLPRSREPLWAHPSIANGVLYMRRASTLYAYDIRGEDYAQANQASQGQPTETSDAFSAVE